MALTFTVVALDISSGLNSTVGLLSVFDTVPTPGAAGITTAVTFPKESSLQTFFFFFREFLLLHYLDHILPHCGEVNMRG